MRLLLALLAAVTVAVATPVPDPAHGHKHTLERRRTFVSIANPLRLENPGSLNCRNTTRLVKDSTLHTFTSGDRMLVTCQTHGDVVGATGNNVWNKVRVWEDDGRNFTCYVPDFYTLSIENGVSYLYIPGVPAC